MQYPQGQAFISFPAFSPLPEHYLTVFNKYMLNRYISPFDGFVKSFGTKVKELFQVSYPEQYWGLETAILLGS